MKISKVVRERIRITGRGVNLVGDTNAAIAVNASEKGGKKSVARASSRQRVTQGRG